MSFTAPVGYTSIAAGTVVSAYAFDGHQIISWLCEAKVGIIVASLALRAVIAQRLQVPRLSVQLVWAAADTVVDESCQISVGVSFVLSSVNPDLFCDDCCPCCGDPHDNDRPYYPDRRESNCFVCGPCYMCKNCHIQLPNGSWNCFECISELDGLEISTTTLKRFELVYPERLHELRAIFHWKMFWCIKHRLLQKPEVQSLGMSG